VILLMTPVQVVQTTVQLTSILMYTVR
jgi:hypothetical protein